MSGTFIPCSSPKSDKKRVNPSVKLETPLRRELRSTSKSKTGKTVSWDQSVVTPQRKLPKSPHVKNVSSRTGNSQSSSTNVLGTSSLAAGSSGISLESDRKDNLIAVKEEKTSENISSVKVEDDAKFSSVKVNAALFKGGAQRVPVSDSNPGAKSSSSQTSVNEASATKLKMRAMRVHVSETKRSRTPGKAFTASVDQTPQLDKIKTQPESDLRKSKTNQLQISGQVNSVASTPKITGPMRVPVSSVKKSEIAAALATPSKGNPLIGSVKKQVPTPSTERAMRVPVTENKKLKSFRTQLCSTPVPKTVEEWQLMSSARRIPRRASKIKPSLPAASSPQTKGLSKIPKPVGAGYSGAILESGKYKVGHASRKDLTGKFDVGKGYATEGNRVEIKEARRRSLSENAMIELRRDEAPTFVRTINFDEDDALVSYASIKREPEDESNYSSSTSMLHKIESTGLSNRAENIFCNLQPSYADLYQNRILNPKLERNMKENIELKSRSESLQDVAKVQKFDVKKSGTKLQIGSTIRSPLTAINRIERRRSRSFDMGLKNFSPLRSPFLIRAKSTYGDGKLISDYDSHLYEELDSHKENISGDFLLSPLSASFVSAVSDKHPAKRLGKNAVKCLDGRLASGGRIKNESGSNQSLERLVARRGVKFYVDEGESEISYNDESCENESFTEVLQRMNQNLEAMDKKTSEIMSNFDQMSHTRQREENNKENLQIQPQIQPQIQQQIQPQIRPQIQQQIQPHCLDMIKQENTESFLSASCTESAESEEVKRIEKVAMKREKLGAADKHDKEMAENESRCNIEIMSDIKIEHVSMNVNSEGNYEEINSENLTGLIDNRANDVPSANKNDTMSSVESFRYLYVIRKEFPYISQSTGFSRSREILNAADVIVKQDCSNLQADLLRERMPSEISVGTSSDGEVKRIFSSTADCLVGVSCGFEPPSYGAERSVLNGNTEISHDFPNENFPVESNEIGLELGPMEPTEKIERYMSGLYRGLRVGCVGGENQFGGEGGVGSKAYFKPIELPPARTVLQDITKDVVTFEASPDDDDYYFLVAEDDDDIKEITDPTTELETSSQNGGATAAEINPALSMLNTDDSVMQPVFSLPVVGLQFSSSHHVHGDGGMMEERVWFADGSREAVWNELDELDGFDKENVDPSSENIFEAILDKENCALQDLPPNESMETSHNNKLPTFTSDFGLLWHGAFSEFIPTSSNNSTELNNGLLNVATSLDIVQQNGTTQGNSVVQNSTTIPNVRVPFAPLPSYVTQLSNSESHQRSSVNSLSCMHDSMVALCDDSRLTVDFSDVSTSSLSFTNSDQANYSSEFVGYENYSIVEGMKEQPRIRNPLCSQLENSACDDDANV